MMAKVRKSSSALPVGRRPLLVGGDRDDGLGSLYARIGDREQQHDDPERVLRLDIGIGNPEPPVVVLDGNMSIPGRRIGDRDPERRADRRYRIAWSGSGLPLRYIGGGHLNDGGEFEHDLQHRARHHVDFVASSRVPP